MTTETMAKMLREFATECHNEAQRMKEDNWSRGFFQGRGDAYAQAAYFIETHLDRRVSS